MDDRVVGLRASPHFTKPEPAVPSCREPPDSRRRSAIRLEERLRANLLRACGDYALLAPGDTVMVCLSGGKDSHALLRLLLDLTRLGKIEARLIVVNLDQKQPGFPAQVLPAYLNGLGVEYHIIEADTYSIVQEKIPPGKTTCSLCSRLRRGVLYRTAKALGANKIALGHHRDDMVQTFFLNLFHGGRLKGMPPKLLTDDGQHLVIRPLAYCNEADLARYASQQNFPLIPCDLCGGQDHLQRQALRRWLGQEERAHPGRTDSIFRALQNITLSHLADRALYDFAALAVASPAVSPSTEQGALRLSALQPQRVLFQRAGLPVAPAGLAEPEHALPVSPASCSQVASS